MIGHVGIFPIEHGDAISAAVFDIVAGDAPEVSGLGVGAAGASEVGVPARPSEMISADVNADAGCAGFLGCEIGIGVVGAFGGFGPGERDAGVFYGGPVDGRLVAGDVGAEGALSEKGEWEKCALKRKQGRSRYKPRTME